VKAPVAGASDATDVEPQADGPFGHDARPVGRLPVYASIVGLVFVVLLSSYSYGAGTTSPASGGVSKTASGGVPNALDAAGCACCGGSGSGASVAGEARVDGAVQRISVDTATGSWSPNEITLKAGVPTQITFAEGRGCLAQVTFPDLGVSADLTNGGAVVSLPALPAGEHTFTCGMNMVFGKLTVR
jgi:hypothetical protein